jgi:protein ImuB
MVDGAGEAIRVDDRGVLSAPPARFSPTGSGSAMRQIMAWAGPWPIDERWWDTETARRAHRFQVVDAAGMAWLLVLDSGTLADTTPPPAAGSWWAEAKYD